MYTIALLQTDDIVTIFLACKIYPFNRISCVTRLNRERSKLLAKMLQSIEDFELTSLVLVLTPDLNRSS